MRTAPSSGEARASRPRGRTARSRPAARRGRRSGRRGSGAGLGPASRSSVTSFIGSPRGRGEGGTGLATGPVEPGAHGPDRDVEDGGDLLVAELGPGESSSASRSRALRPASAAASGPASPRRPDAVVRLVRRRARGGVRLPPGRAPGSGAARPDVPVHHVGRDPDQPRPDLDVLGPVGRPPPEGDQEGLAQQVVGEIAHPAAEVAVHGVRVPVEQGRELAPGRPRSGRSARRPSAGLRQRAQGRRARCGHPSDIWRGT